MPTPNLVRCPRCGKSVTWAPESRYRPFCSERCKHIDLGAWANEAYRVPSVETEAEPASETPPATSPD
ncbi:MAG: DNA gyrase inhibitor YacG [Rhodocyclaceae bacterium]|nr:DNA gyrase inhibitor YacG [Rhodocyclaceae bacterium]